jgi:hypothetical protein
MTPPADIVITIDNRNRSCNNDDILDTELQQKQQQSSRLVGLDEMILKL